jgi:hypothetical protein
MATFATWAPQGYAVKGTATATTGAAATEVAAGRASSSVLRQPHRSASTATRVPPPPSPRPSPRMEGRRGWAARSSTATADEGVGGSVAVRHAAAAGWVDGGHPNVWRASSVSLASPESPVRKHTAPPAAVRSAVLPRGGGGSFPARSRFSVSSAGGGEDGGSTYQRGAGTIAEAAGGDGRWDRILSEASRNLMPLSWHARRAHRALVEGPLAPLAPMPTQLPGSVEEKVDPRLPQSQRQSQSQRLAEIFSVDEGWRAQCTALRRSLANLRERAESDISGALY